MSDVPPPQFASYPRQSTAPYGSAAKLQELGKGYFGLNTVFIINLVIAFAAKGFIEGGT